jgi:hypothetical protein
LKHYFKYFICFVFTANSFCFFSQSFGSYTFSSLDAIYSARALGLGGSLTSISSNDISVGVSNPSLIRSEFVNKLSFHQILQSIGVQYGMINYGFALNKERNIYQLSSLRYVNYGRMNETDIGGNIIGTFNPMDLLLSHGIGYQMTPKLSFGCQAVIISGFYLNQAQVGVGFDLSGTWQINEYTSVAALVKNIGTQKIIHSAYQLDLLPFEIQATITHKLKYAPFRFSMLMHHLNKFDISYFDPNDKGQVDVLTGEKILPEKSSVFEKIAQHLIPQVEILLGKSFELRCGYNIYTRQNSGILNNLSFSGLSFGVGLSFQRFSIDYGFKRMSSSGSYNGIALQLNLNEWKRKK